MYVAACLTVFLLAYTVIIVTTSIGYHRGLAHGAVRLPRVSRWLLTRGGIWLTGIDPKGWVVMHRMHHKHSDTVDDPHSPSNVGLLGMFRAQLDGYNRVLLGLKNEEPAYVSMGRDLETSWAQRKGLWFLPYAAHVALGVVVGIFAGPFMGIALFSGLMSHVVQGAIINYFGHAHGGRNFDSSDDSRNNHVAAWLVLGEGFQNNHHRYPSSARFSHRFPEVDLGFAVCRVLEKVRALDVVEGTLMPRALTPRPSSTS